MGGCLLAPSARSMQHHGVSPSARADGRSERMQHHRVSPSHVQTGSRNEGVMAMPQPFLLFVPGRVRATLHGLGSAAFAAAMAAATRDYDYTQER